MKINLLAKYFGEYFLSKILQKGSFFLRNLEVIKMDNLLNKAQVAKIFGVTVPTLRAWAEKGTLVPAVTLPSGRERYTETQVSDFIAKGGKRYSRFSESKE